MVLADLTWLEAEKLLLRAGEARLLQKLGEESIEVIVAAQAESEQRLISEAADMVYHLMLLLVSRDLSCEAVDNEMRNRYASQ